MPLLDGRPPAIAALGTSNTPRPNAPRTNLLLDDILIFCCMGGESASNSLRRPLALCPSWPSAFFFLCASLRTIQTSCSMVSALAPFLASGHI